MHDTPTSVDACCLAWCKAVREHDGGGLNSTYDATWLPIERQAAGGEDPTALAVEYVDRRCTQTQQPGVLVTHTRGDLATPSLEWFAEKHRHVTRRSHSDVSPGSGPVLVDMPDADLLALAHFLARGTSLCAMESGALRLNGWAAATHAVDLVTEEHVAPLTEEVLKLLEHLIFAGNSGWADEPGKRDAQRLLRSLASADTSLDADFIAGFVIGRGKSSAAAKRLHKMFPTT